VSAHAVDRPRGLRRFVTLFRLWRREQQDPEPFYRLLAAEAAEDLERRYGPLRGKRVVDLGCGPGFYTRALRERGAEVVPVDNDVGELELAGEPPAGFVLADATALPIEDGSVDGVLCSNMLEHTPDPKAVVGEIARVLRPGGWGYVSWTNWYSPWGGHLIAPYHYLGPRLGPRVHERFHGRPRKNAYGEALWAVHIGPMLRYVRGLAGVEIERVEPRYWPRLAFIVRIPLLRELLTWNCVIRMRKLG
jgi:SAM-dependent methyltransferase